MTEPQFIRLPYKLERVAPSFETNAIKYPESLVRYFMKLYTKRGANVFDPFAGLGTTLFVAEELGRMPFGMEADEEHHAWTAGQLQNWLNLRRGDAAKMDKIGFPKMDFCMTSPPFMRISDKWNPLYAGDPAKAGYAAYLRRMEQIFAKLTLLMKRNATLVVQVDNLSDKVFTPLVRDLSLVVSKSFKPMGEVIVAYEKAPKDYPHTHCLLFKPR